MGSVRDEHSLAGHTCGPALHKTEWFPPGPSILASSAPSSWGSCSSYTPLVSDLLENRSNSVLEVLVLQDMARVKQDILCIFPAGPGSELSKLNSFQLWIIPELQTNKVRQDQMESRAGVEPHASLEDPAVRSSHLPGSLVKSLKPGSPKPSSSHWSSLHESFA